MNPGTLVADIHHLKQVGVQTCFTTGASEQGFMGPGRARGDHHTVEVLLFYGLFDLIDPTLRAGIEVSQHKNHMGKLSGKFFKLLHIKVSGNIGPAMAEEYPDPDIFFLVRQQLSPFLIPIETRFPRRAVRRLMPAPLIQAHPWGTRHSHRQKYRESLYQRERGNWSL